MRKHSSNFCRNSAIAALLLSTFLVGCASGSKHTIMGPPGKLTLPEAEKQLQESKAPIQRTRNYIQISDILLRHARNETLQDNGNASVLLNQYRDSILSAQHTLFALRKSSQRYAKDYMKFEVVLRHHIRWLNDWKLELAVPDREPVNEAMDTAIGVREELLRSFLTADEVKGH